MFQPAYQDQGCRLKHRTTPDLDRPFDARTSMEPENPGGVFMEHGGQAFLR